MMFDTERFIVEVQIRDCLWDSRIKPDRTAKKRAWEEIGKICNPTWDEETEKKQLEFVEDLQKKWKNLRDYYVKEKKEDSLRSGSAAPKRRKNSYVEMLRFLDILKESRISSGNVRSPVGENNPENSCGESSTNTNSRQTVESSSSIQSLPSGEVPRTSQILNKSKMTPFQQSLIAAMNPKQAVPKEEKDADTKFLLYLLPQVKSFDERQNCEFRMEVMNLIYKNKYNTTYMSQNQYSDQTQYRTYYEPARHAHTAPSQYQGYTTRSSMPSVQSPESIHDQVQSPELVRWTRYTSQTAPQEYQGYTSRSSVHSVQSPESIHDQVQSPESVSTIEEIEDILQN